jgi:hypothetical protein
MMIVRGEKAVIPLHSIETYGEMEVKLYTLTSALDGGELSALRCVPFTPGKVPT